MRGRWRPLRDRRSVAGAVAVAIALVVTIAVAPWPSGPSHPPRAETVADGQRPAGCPDVLVVGLDGNGQQPSRRPHLRAHRRHRRTPSGRPGEGERAFGLGRPRPADHAPRVRGPPARSAAPTRAPSGRSRSRGSAPGGSRSPTASAPPSPLVTDRIARCPERPVLLVGFAQGASVVHRVIGRVSDSGGLSHLVGGITIADPDRLARSVVRPVLGDPAGPGPSRRDLPGVPHRPSPTSPPPRAPSASGRCAPSQTWSATRRGRPSATRWPPPGADAAPPPAAPRRRRRRLAPAGAVAGAGAAPPGGDHRGGGGRAPPARTGPARARPARRGATPPGSRPA